MSSERPVSRPFVAQRRELLGHVAYGLARPIGAFGGGPAVHDIARRSVSPSKRFHVERPVLVLHGFSSCPTHVALLGGRLAGRVGADVHYLALPTLRRGVDHAADLAAARIERIAQRLGHPVHLVGHSLGGVAAYAASLRVDPGTVSGLVTLCSPLQGMPGPYLGRAPFAAVRDLQAGSRFHRRLAAQEAEAARSGHGPDHMVAFTAYDDEVVPCQVATLSPALGKTIYVPDHGHNSVLLDGGIATAVGAELCRAEAATAVRPSAGSASAS